MFKHLCHQHQQHFSSRTCVLCAISHLLQLLVAIIHRMITICIYASISQKIQPKKVHRYYDTCKILVLITDIHLVISQLLSVPWMTRALILYRRRRFINHLLTYLLTLVVRCECCFSLKLSCHFALNYRAFSTSFQYTVRTKWYDDPYSEYKHLA